ncbi:hypothetical protein JCM19231_1728 [Vibrio ishigakensis]|uniref:Uncharacterized protein n=2 Tax=Vibrio ishigakensis TaxID=1481914 RepID=A0A0B8P8Z4_9VIBR|nr:hypothetical protein JCM19231_1728 [Vibrio ishigakensis]
MSYEITHLSEGLVEEDVRIRLGSSGASTQENEDFEDVQPGLLQFYAKMTGSQYDYPVNPNHRVEATFTIVCDDD